MANTAPSFTATTGRAITDFGSSDFGRSVTVQADGRILVAGSSDDSTGYGNFALARYNSDGSLDTSFDADGKLTTDFGSSDQGYSVAVQADGRILVAGNSDFNFALARYNTNGSLDTSFDLDGKVITDFGSYDYFGSITVQADGKILVAGSAYGSGMYFALARYNTDGSLDTSFDMDGMVTTGTGSNTGRSVTLQSDGKILVAGSFSGNFALVRYNTNGSLDTSFDLDGMVTTDFGLNSYQVEGNSITVQADGKILVAGSSGNFTASDFTLVRYNTDGSLDTSFDTDGKVTTDFGGSVVSGFDSNDQGRSVTLQSDGKILVAGTSSNGANIALVRYNSDGSLDTSFDLDGKLTTAFGASNQGYSITLQSDGKILMAGSSDSDFALVRYNTDGSLDTTFFAPENTLDASPAYTEGNYYSPVVLDEDVQIVDAELSAANNYNGATLTLARHAGASAQDVFSAQSGGTLTTLLAGSYFGVDGITIGQVTTNGSGILTLSFNSNATQSLVNKAMQQIAYSNSSDAPPTTVQIDWNFNDGNSGTQGTGGALSVTGSTTVQITPTNDYPILALALVDQFVVAGNSLSCSLPSGSFTDPDGESLIYQMTMANGTATPPWLTFNTTTRTFSGTPGTTDVGSLNIMVTATDSAAASVSDYFIITVTPSDTTAPTVTTLNPADAATGVALANDIVVTFSEAIQRGTGSIVLKNAAGATIETFDAATSSNLLISGTTLTINPTADLANGTSHFVTFASGTIKDLAGNAYTGITTYDFTTVATPVTVTGGVGNDTLTGGAGNDSLDGGAGIDIANFTGNRANFTVTQSGTGFIVADTTGDNGIDTLTNIERLSFADTKIALDVAGSNAGITAKILGAVFGAASVSSESYSKQYVGIGLSYLDSGMSYQDLMLLALNARLGAGFSNADEVNLLYQNLVGSLPSAADLNYWTGTLNAGQFTQASLAVMAADLDLNTTNINLVGLAQTGIEFV